jgi:L-aminopeptidase/D-esterase-like protein
MGAKAGRLKGGLGSASFVTESGLAVGAVMAVNPSGSVLVPGTRTFWAWNLAQGDELGPQTPPTGPIDPMADLFPDPPPLAGGNTTIGVVATNAKLSKAEANRLAIMAQDGMARAIRPCHTPFDGDTMFVLATGAVELPDPRPALLSLLGSMAADCVARAIARGVYQARPLGPWPAYAP